MEVSVSKCRKESGEVDGFVFLPDDILLDILKRLPDTFLRYKAKHVCRRWFYIITNMILRRYHASFILQKSSEIYKVRLVDIREEGQGLEVKEQNLDIPCSGRIKSWYNEFLLISDPFTGNYLYAYNLITNKRSYLPKCHKSCQVPNPSPSRCGVALFFDGCKGVYKVVYFYMGTTIEFHILILERDIVSGLSSSKWKKMKVPPDMENWQYNHGNPVSVQVQGRYFHCDVGCSNCLVSVDMLKEEIFQISLPGSDRTSNLYSILEMGGFLTLIDGGGVGAILGKADIWILKDFQRMKWEKLQSITVDPDDYVRKYPGNCFLLPVCGVISKRYFIFMKPRSRIYICVAMI